jgi:mannosyltransferase
MKRFISPVLAALAGLTVCSWGITDRQVWRDEHSTWWAATIPFDALLRLISNLDAVIAPYYLLMRGILAVAGESPLALRLPSALAITAACALLCQLGTRMFSARVGLYAALLFAIVPNVSRYGQEARPYALVLAVCIGSSLLLLRALDQPTWGRFLAYAGGLVALGALHLVALCSLGAHLLLVLLSPAKREPSFDKRRVVFGFALSVLGALLLLAPLAFVGRQQVGQISWTLTQQASLPALPRMVALSPYVGKVLLGLACVGMVRMDRYRLFLATWAALPPLLLYFSQDWLHLFVHRYLLFVLPAWCMLAALALDDLGQLLARTPSMRLAPQVLPLLVVVVLLASARRAHAVARTGNGRSYDYRSLVEVLKREATPKDGIAFSGRGACGGWARLAMQYELREGAFPRDIFVSRSQSDVGWFAAEECQDLAPCLPPQIQRLWLVTCGEDPDVFSQYHGNRSEVLRREFTVARVHPFANIEIARLERNPRK